MKPEKKLTTKKQVQPKNTIETLLFQDVSDTCPDPILLTNTDGIICYVNPSWEKLTGYTRTEVIGKKPEIVKSERTNKTIYDKLWEALTDEKPFVTEDMIDKRKDGTEFYVHATFFPILRSKAPIYYIQVLQDITERLQMKKTLEESEEQLQALVDNARGYAIYMLDSNGCVATWNRSAEHMSGYAKEEVLGKHVSLFYTKDLIAQNKPREMLAIAEKTGKFEGEVRRSRKNGTEYWASISISAIRDLKGKLKGFVQITHDITTRKELEKQRDEFIGVASHELKTPITSLKIYSAILEKQIQEGNKKTINILGRMSFQTNKLISLIEDLINADRIESGKIELDRKEFDLTVLVRNVLDNLQYTITSHELVQDGDISTPVIADENRIEQVLISLIMNAVKFSPRGTKVTVHLSTEKGHALIAVQDFGQGIPKTDQQKIFQKFYQTESQIGTGFGLGLYIASEIIKKHGEKIWVESKKGEGSTFYFTLPMI